MSSFAANKFSPAVNVHIRPAEFGDTESVSGVLVEAAEWLRARGIPMWRAGELSPERIAADVARREFFVAEVGHEIAGTIKFQLEDELFWPDQPLDEAAFVHRLAVRRKYSRGVVSSVLLRWAADRGRSLGRRFLRLDCDAARPALRAVYERFGFRYHSCRQVGPYLVARYEQPLQ